MELASEEILKEVMERSNADEKYLELEKGEDASYTFIIQSEPQKGVEKNIVSGYTVEHAKISDIWLGERKTEFTISGKDCVWANTIIGKNGVTKAFLLRKLKVRRSLMKALKMSKATERSLEILRTIPTEFHGEYVKYNIKR